MDDLKAIFAHPERGNTYNRYADYEHFIEWMAFPIKNTTNQRLDEPLKIKWVHNTYINCLLDKEPNEINYEDLDNLIIINDPDNPQLFRIIYLLNTLKECLTLEKCIRDNQSAIKVLVNRKKFTDYLIKFSHSAIDNQRIYRPPLEKFIAIFKIIYGTIDIALKDKYLNNQIVKSINVHLPQRYSKLYRYQELNVEWIKKIEEISPITFYLPNQYYFQVAPNEEVYFTDNFKAYNRNIYYSVNDLFENNIISQQTLNGGILADEMGTGKTAVMITHILSVIQKEKEPILPDGFEGHIPVKATLIVCPSHIVDQWINEFQKFLLDGMKPPKIVRITGKNEYLEYTYNDIINADIVIVHYNFFNNPIFAQKHTEILASGMPPPNLQDNRRRRFEPIVARRMSHEYLPIFANYFKQFPLTKKDLNTNRPFLLYFYWKRVVLDEGHDFLGKINPLDRLYGQYKWLMTGTPMIKINENLRFLSNAIINADVAQSFTPFWDSLKMLNIMRRNTQQSVAEEINLSKFKMTETTININFNVNEALVYQSQQGDERKREFLRKFCCYPFLPDGLQEVKRLDQLLEYLHKKERDEAKQLLQRRNALRVEINELIQNPPPDFQRQLGIKRRGLDDIEAKFGISCRRIRFFEETLIPTFKNNQDIECPVCMTEINDFIAITICGHYLCNNCMEQHKRSQARGYCPTCRGNISNPSAVFKAMVRQLEDEANQEANKHLNKYGSKVKAIILKIREIFNQDPTNAIIIFAEWDHILRTIVSILKKEGMKPVYCKGNITSRTRAVNSFALEETSNIICLSSEYASHGTNLTRANKIIFVHPVGKDLKTRRDIEEQAIARAKRIGQYRDLEVIRFVIQNSIEQDIYTATH